jgi:flagellin
MATRINTNTLAMSAARNAGVNDRNVASSIEKLSSGLRINRAADDAAGLVISENMRAQIAGLDQAGRNTNDAINMIKTAEGALSEVHDLLRTMRNLAVHAASSGTNEASVQADQDQFNSAIDSIQRISNTTSFNGKKLLAGTASGTTAVSFATNSFTFQIGANEGESVDVTIENLDIQSLKLGTLTRVASTTGTSTTPGVLEKISVSTATSGYLAVNQKHDTANFSTIELLDKAIQKVSDQRAKLGAFQKNTLESTVNSLAVAKENLSASESAIRDTDMADEMVRFTKNNILSQASQAMLSQANNSSQGILQLLRG